MKTISQKLMKIVISGLLFTIILFSITSWKNPDKPKPTFKERVLEQEQMGKKVAVFTNILPVGFQHLAVDENSLCQIGTGMVIAPQGAITNFRYTGWFEEKTPVAYDVSSMVADQLNAGMSTDVFVAVAQDEVADKTVTALGIETVIKDWWNSNYTIVVEISMMAQYSTASGVDPFKTNIVVAPLMYVREVVAGKEALGFVVNGRALGSSASDIVEHTQCYTSLDDLKTNIGDPGSLLDQATAGIAEPMTKFIDKQNAKYAKAMKKKK